MIRCGGPRPVLRDFGKDRFPTKLSAKPSAQMKTSIILCPISGDELRNKIEREHVLLEKTHNTLCNQSSGKISYLI
jgi:hypothetical protein